MRKYPRPGRRRLRPRLEAWKNWEVELFLVGLWAADGKDVTRVLTRFLRRRHWKHNHGFVVDVIRQGLQVPDKVRDRLRRGLVEQVTNPQTLDDWREAATALVHVDPDAAVEKLEAVLRDDTGKVVRIEALRLLLTLDRRRGITAANYLIFADRADPEARLRAAKVVFEADRSHGLRTLVRLTATAELRELRVDAAQLVFGEDAARGREILRRLVEDPRCPDQARLVAAETLCAHDPDQISALALLSRDHAAGFETRLAAAVAAVVHRRATGAELLAELAQDLRNPAGVRRRAARALGDADVRAIPLLRELAMAGRDEPEDRFDAALALAEVDPEAGLDALLTLADDERLGQWRIDSAKAAGQYPAGRDRALDRLTELAGHTGVEFAVRRFAAHSLHELDPDRGIGALTRLVTGPGNPSDRLDVIEDLADLSSENRAVDLLRTIVDTDGETVSMRGKAAARLKSMRPAVGARAYRALAKDGRIPAHQRAEFATQVGDKAEAVALLGQIAAGLPSDQAVAVIKQMESLDPAGAAAAYRRVAGRAGVGYRTRTSAMSRAMRLDPPAQNRSETSGRQEPKENEAPRLTKKQQLRAQVEQAGNKKLKPEERFTAAEAVAKRDPRQGKEVLQALVDDRKIPKAVRVKAEKAMKRFR
ncbi:hypothetical protein ACWEVP_24405 [Amycolatopsis sp. NPDC003865]